MLQRLEEQLTQLSPFVNFPFSGGDLTTEGARHNLGYKLRPGIHIRLTCGDRAVT